MKQFVLSRGAGDKNNVTLEGDDYHYLVHVRRHAAGDEINVVTKDGEQKVLRVTKIKDGVLTGSLSCARPLRDGRQTFDCDVILFQAVLKRESFDLVVRLAAEWGVNTLVPILAEHCASTGENASLPSKIERAQRIIKSAREQSGSAVNTEICAPLPLKNALSAYGEMLALGETAAFFLHEKPVGRAQIGDNDTIENHCTFHHYLGRGDELKELKTVCISTGPEGGFSNTEVGAFLNSRFIPIYLGPNVLRAETAALSAISAVRVILGEGDSWKLK
jgi:16S rRNA (uracil1498-N3)-methyltransferase